LNRLARRARILQDLACSGFAEQAQEAEMAEAQED